MKLHILLFTLSTTFFTNLNAQQPAKKEPWPVMPNSPNYYEVREHYLDHIGEHIAENELFGLDADGDGLYAKFYRWDHLMKTRVDAAGNYPDPRTAFLEWEKLQQKYGSAMVGERAANWMPVGTADVPDNGGGAGRINVIVLDPIEPNTMYAGSAGGGLWKTADLGESWVPMTDNIPALSISDVVVDHTNNNIIYIATGDTYGHVRTWQLDNDFWGGLYSAGILKSTDGGMTWLPTGLSYQQEELKLVRRLIMQPDDPDILLAATTEGIYRTDDGGDTWSMALDVHCYDFALHATNPDIMYAVGDRDMYITTDGGLTWEIKITNIAPFEGRMSIETTADDPDLIYIFSIGAEMHKSVDGGTTWSSLPSPGEAVTFYGNYDLVLEVSDQNKDLIFTGGLDMARSINGGLVWTKKTNSDDHTASNYVHADAKCILFDPNDENVVYAANDGGVFKSGDKGQTWVDISDGLRIAQVYRLSTSASNPGMVLSGWQDNGCNVWDGSTWKRILNADGMEVIIDPVNEDRLFASQQWGMLYRSLNGGDTWFEVDVPSGGWLAPYTIDPNYSMGMFFGDTEGRIWKSLDGGNDWWNLGVDLGDDVFDIQVAPSNGDFVYACSLSDVFVSSNIGVTWTNITPDLPVSGIGFNYIAISDEDPDHVWVALSGYSDGNKVLFSSDRGATWTNISGGLPNVPVNCIVYENVSDSDRIYVGTDIGVFTKSNDSDWEPYMTGLPGVMIHELEINYSDYKLYAATYGRGIWMSELYNFTPPSMIVSVPDLSYCTGETMEVYYTATGSFDTSNVFIVEMSDAGTFTAPDSIGSLETNLLSGMIVATIPEDKEGDLFRVRITASDPAFISSDNGANISIGCKKPEELNAEVISATSITLTWADVECAEGYELRYKSALDADYTSGYTTTTSFTLTGLLPSTSYEWSVRTICDGDADVSSSFASDAYFSTGQNQVIDLAGVSGFNIFPNPAKKETSIQFDLMEGAAVHMQIVDMNGREVLTVMQSQLAEGAHHITVDISDLAAGNYMLMLTLNGSVGATSLVIE